MRFEAAAFELADVEQIMDRNAPHATAAAVEAVLFGLPQAIADAAGGAPDDGLVSLNGPLMDFEPVVDLLGWFDPQLVNTALVALGKGDAYPLQVVLDAMGLLRETGEAYALHVALAREVGL